MKKIDSIGLKMCSYQASLFEYSIEQTKCSSAIFVRRFMNSDLAKRMDSTGFLFDSTNFRAAIDELESQYGSSTYGIEKYTHDEMHWMGYIYRYWAYVSDKTSKQVYRMMKPGELRKLFFPYHSLDPAQAIGRILEANGIDINNQIARGVEILRRVRKKSEK